MAPPVGERIEAWRWFGVVAAWLVFGLAWRQLRIWVWPSIYHGLHLTTWTSPIGTELLGAPGSAALALGVQAFLIAPPDWLRRDVAVVARTYAVALGIILATAIPFFCVTYAARVLFPGPSHRMAYLWFSLAVGDPLRVVVRVLFGFSVMLAIDARTDVIESLHRSIAAARGSRWLLIAASLVVTIVNTSIAVFLLRLVRAPIPQLWIFDTIATAAWWALSALIYRRARRRRLALTRTELSEAFT